MIPKTLIKLVFLIIYLLMFCCDTFAQVTVEAGVKYKKSEYSYSEYYFREIDIATGVELNKASYNPRYEPDSDYVLIWFSQDNVAVIKLDEQIQNNFDRQMGHSINKSALEFSCIRDGYTKEGTDQSDVRWKICFYSSSWKFRCD